jgi:hypothetical protein
MASTTRSSNGRSKQAGTRGAAAANRSANGSSSGRANGSSGGAASRSSRSGTSRSPRNSANGGSRSGTSRSSRTSANGSSRTTAAKRKIATASTTVGSAAKKAKTPLVAGGAAAAGLATGTTLGFLLRGSRRPHVLGMPMPRGDDMKSGAKKALRAGRWLYDMETDLRLLREHAEQSRRQSPIEVLLSGLTSRTLPRGR